MGWNAVSFRIGTLISGALLFTFQAAGGPPGYGRGVAPVAPLSSAPTPRGGGYVNWHAASNLGMHPASWNIGPAWNFGPTHVTAPGWNNGGYHRGWGNGNGYGYGYGGLHNGVRRGVIVPVYPIYPALPLYDSGYGYSDDSESAPPPPDSGADYTVSSGNPYAPPPPYQPAAPPAAYQPSAPPAPYQPPAAPSSEYQQQPAVPAQPEPVVVQPPITVVLQNGQKLVVQNYAVVDAMLWDFSKPVARKIPLSTIDVSASAIATYEAGGEFPQLTPPAQ